MATHRFFELPAAVHDQRPAREDRTEDGIRIFRAALVGVVLSIPFWALCFWAVIHFFLPD